MSGVFKGIAVVLGILDVVGAIIIANMFGDFSFPVFFAVILVSAMGVLLIYAVGEHLGNQEETNSLLREILRRSADGNEKPASHIGMGSVSAPTRPVPPPANTASGGYFSRLPSVPWTCPSCNTANSKTRDTCENCGKRR